MAEPTGGVDHVGSVRDAFMVQQNATWDTLTQTLDPSVKVAETDPIENTQSIARPRVCSDGDLIEKAACSFTHSEGQELPPAASERNPRLSRKTILCVRAFSDRAPEIAAYPYSSHERKVFSRRPWRWTLVFRRRYGSNATFPLRRRRNYLA